MSTERPVVVRLASGAEYGMASIAKAEAIYPNGVVVRYQDGTMIDPEDLDTGEVVATGDEPVNAKMSRKQLEAIATAAGIEGADNTSAYKDKAALIERIESERAETGSQPLVANPEFRDHSREDLEQFATEWYKIDPAEYEDDEDLRLILVDAYDADTGGSGESE